MTTLIAYGTTEGQTRKIAEFAARQLAGLGEDVQLHNCEDAQLPLNVDRIGAVLIAASVHNWQHQTSMVDFVIEQRHWIATRPNAFISVSLSEAFEEDRPEAHLYIDQFIEETGWQPQMKLSLAGAMRYREYDFMRRWAMRFMATLKGAPTDFNEDYEYTDWGTLRSFLDDFHAFAIEMSLQDG